MPDAEPQAGAQASQTERHQQKHQPQLARRDLDLLHGERPRRVVGTINETNAEIVGSEPRPRQLAEVLAGTEAGAAALMECGEVVMNGSGFYRTMDIAFGGYKMSGLGREGISSTLEELSQVKTIVLKGVLG
mgnify:CR=1 FL=1